MPVKIISMKCIKKLGAVAGIIKTRSNQREVDSQETVGVLPCQ